MAKLRSQRELAQTLLKKQWIMRLEELREAGVTAATVSRVEQAGEVLRLPRGVYRPLDAGLDPNQAAAAKRGARGRRMPRIEADVSRPDAPALPKSLMPHAIAAAKTGGSH